MFYFSTTPVGEVILLFASSFLRMELVPVPRLRAGLLHSIAQPTVVTWLWSGCCWTIGQILCFVMMMAHPLYIRHECLLAMHSKTFLKNTCNAVSILYYKFDDVYVFCVSRLQNEVTWRCVSCFSSTAPPSKARWTKGSSFLTSWHQRVVYRTSWDCHGDAGAQC